MSRSPLIDIDVQLHHTTDRAVLVSTDGDNTIWVPLSLCEIVPKGGGGKLYELTLPEDIAIEKGLI